MNQLDVSGILTTYASKARYARNQKHLKEIIRDLKQELDLRKVKFEKDKQNQISNGNINSLLSYMTNGSKRGRDTA